MVEELKVHMRWLRVALVLSFIAGFLATMAAETFEQKFLMGAVFSAVLGLLWAVLPHSVRRADNSDWDVVTKNVAEAQNLIIKALIQHIDANCLGYSQSLILNLWIF